MSGWRDLFGLVLRWLSSPPSTGPTSGRFRLLENRWARLTEDGFHRLVEGGKSVVPTNLTVYGSRNNLLTVRGSRHNALTVRGGRHNSLTVRVR